MNKNNFFDDILNENENIKNEEKNDNIEFSFENDEEQNIDEDENIDDINFSFEYDENIEDEKILNDKKEKEIKKEDNYKRTKDEVKESVEELQGSINSMLNIIKVKPEDMFPDKNLLPGLDIEIESHDYDKDIELIKIESKETLECLANLYLTEEQMKTKNIYNIIKDDSKTLSKLNFSISMGQRSLILCMKQLDLGVNDPDMFQSVTMFMKEIRDNVKMLYDLQKKMKDFYKELKAELQEINAGSETFENTESEDNYTIIGDPKMLNDLFDEMKKDPKLLNDMLNRNKI